jgi:hypothetical protein
MFLGVPTSGLVKAVESRAVAERIEYRTHVFSISERGLYDEADARLQTWGRDGWAIAEAVVIADGRLLVIFEKPTRRAKQGAPSLARASEIGRDEEDE